MTNQYPHTNEIKSFLKGKSELVQQEGLNYLIPNWKLFAEMYASCEDMIYEWLNDLDTRKVIDEILGILPSKERINIENELRPIDNEMIEKTFEINECVWDMEGETENNYDRQRHWYYFRINQKIFDKEAGKFTKRQ